MEHFALEQRTVDEYDEPDSLIAPVGEPVQIYDVAASRKLCAGTFDVQRSSRLEASSRIHG